MKIVTLGLGAGGTDAGAQTVRIAFRGPPVLPECDAVRVDLDAIRAEYRSEVDGDEDPALLNARASHEILQAARGWRNALAEFMDEERFVVVGWSEPPIVRVHTLQDVVAFGLADLFPGVAPGVTPRTAVATRVVAGEPLATFYRVLGASDTTPLASRCELQPLRGEVTLANEGGSAAAVYAFVGGAHFLATPLPTGAASDAAVARAISALAQRIGGARASEYLPWWVESIELPGEKMHRDELRQLVAERARLESRLRAARAQLAVLRRRKALAGGSPEQAARAAREWLGELGAILMRDFADADAFVCAGHGNAALLLAFVSDRATAPVVIARCERLAEQFRHELDESCMPVVIVSCTDASDRDAARAVRLAPALAAAAAAGCCVLRTGPEVLDTLSRPDLTLAERLAAIGRRTIG